MKLRMALGQINSVVGDIDRNVDCMLAVMAKAKAVGAQVVAFPELAVTGYPPEDLVLRPHFLRKNKEAVDRLAAAAQGLVVVAGFIDVLDDAYNAAAVCADGRVVGVYHKNRLPNYGVFDEYRYFQTGVEPFVFKINGHAIGVTICEDIWVPDGPGEEEVVAGGAEVVLNLSASPYYMGKIAQRENMLATRASDMGVYLAFCNLVGGQDELVFDGTSVVFDSDGTILARGTSFAEDLVICDLDLEAVLIDRLRDPRSRVERYLACKQRRAVPTVSLDLLGGEFPPLENDSRPLLSAEEEVTRALVLGLHDYVRKNGFEKVILGLSGGIDSALVAALAVEALGPTNVLAAFMPSRFSSDESREDAEALARNLDFRLYHLPIEPGMKIYDEMLASVFADKAPDITEENIQARIRGNLLMAISNKFGYLVLSTANKSESAVGYSTLYGDMAGGFALLKDCPKTWVYRISSHLNKKAGRELIPERVLTKAPTAELRPNQKDTDSLPPYEVLDPILDCLVVQERSVAEVVALGYEKAMVRRVMRLVQRAEYKRRQAAPGVKLTYRNFGKDRRWPITNRYLDE